MASGSRRRGRCPGDRDSGVARGGHGGSGAGAGAGGTGERGRRRDDLELLGLTRLTEDEKMQAFLLEGLW